ncbi:MAG: potassium transporter, partial [Myxococcaceae bacterium]|nr:potassium transporter [Myxococcaceae bacterium]
MMPSGHPPRAPSVPAIERSASIRPPRSLRSLPDISGPGHHTTGSIAALTVAALGIVFGDIGTSPLY